jgi:hypothetical protein
LRRAVEDIGWACVIGILMVLVMHYGLDLAEPILVFSSGFAGALLYFHLELAKSSKELTADVIPTALKIQMAYIKEYDKRVALEKELEELRESTRESGGA